ncbi:MAG: PrsW family intramembrane metalloprotease [Anaerolineae bacterium]
MHILIILFISFAPMLLYAALLWWLDRYEKEPLGLLGFAFMWGAIPSIILSLLLEILFDVPLLVLSGQNTLVYQLLGASLAAPIIEEGTKALAVLGLFIFFPREIDSPLDGLVYGGMVGFGFAAVENFFYLMTAYESGGLSGAFGLALLRAGLFGLNHAMYTAFTGLGVALALELRRIWLVVMPLLGLALSIAAHAYHNTFATFWGVTEGAGALFTAAAGDWAAVLILLVVAVWARWLEGQRIRAYLHRGYAGGAALSPDEVALLASPWRRQWARWNALISTGPRRWWQEGRYQRLVTEAAFKWHRAQRGDERSQEKLQQVEAKVREVRARL